jgi:type II secretory pathway predicted ATPase ExeA
MLCVLAQMYETQFGLTKRPFRALATGSDVFVGPQTAVAMAGLKKALAAPDAIVCVTGPVGVGKTTTVRRALSAIGSNQVVVTVGRMQLGHDEVLELLLEEMGVEMPAGTVQRFTAFRRLLLQHADAGARVFIVVEDMMRVGPDALAELEALTASDAGVSEGASIILMGDKGSDKALHTPQLERLRQRLRLKQAISPLDSKELLGYFKHCFRLAGAEFDAVFEDGSASVLHRLSDGIPRVANNLVESSLISAAENRLDKVNVAQIKLVADEEYGLRINGEAPPATPVIAEPEAAAASPATEMVPEPVAEIPEPVAEIPEPVAEIEDDVPAMIQDTLPDLEVLNADLVQPAVDPVPEWERDPTLAQLRPDLDALEQAMAVAQGLDSEPEDEKISSQPTPEKAPEAVPEITLDREIEAKVSEAEKQLKEEQAKREAAKEKEQEESGIDDRPIAEILAEAQAKKSGQARDNSVEAQFTAAAMTADAPGTQPANPGPALTTNTEADLPVLNDMTNPSFEPAAHMPPPEQPAETVAEALPELTLEPEPETPAEPEVKAEPTPDPEELEKSRKADAELEQIATNLARARTIDDCDDKMAETLFGEEFSMMAAQVAANAPPELSANDPSAASEPEAVSAEEPAPATLADFDGATALNVELQTGPGNVDTSASQRLATVRALNSGTAQMTPEPAAAPEPRPQPQHQPQSIEEQINLSMTQTLEAMSIPPASHEVDDDEDQPRRGFFSRFKRS